MIIDIFSKLIIWLIDIICWFLPTWKMPSFVMSSFEFFVGHIVLWVSVFPFLKAMIVSFLLLIIYKTSMLIANLVFGFMALVRGSGKPSV